MTPRVARVPLRRLFTVINGGTPTPDSSNWGGEVPWATPVDLAKVDGHSIARTDRTLTDEGLRSGSRLVPTGSIVVSTRAPIGYVATVEQETAFNQGCRGLVPRDAGAVDVRFVKYQLLGRREDLQAAGNGTTFQELPSEALASFRVAYGPIGEQRRVADFLDAETARIDSLITAKQQMAELVGARALAAIRRLVTQDTAFQDPLEVRPYECRPGFRPMRLSWAFTIGSGTTPSSDDGLLYGLGTPWVTTSDLRDRDISSDLRQVTPLALERYSALKVHPAESLVVAMYGATIGRLGILKFGATVNQACCVLHPRGDDSAEFVFYWLLAHRADLIRRGTGAGQSNISGEIVGKVRIAMPPRDQQTVIVASAKEVEADRKSITSTLVRQIELLRERRLALISSAVSGELAV